MATQPPIDPWATESEGQRRPPPQGDPTFGPRRYRRTIVAAVLTFALLLALQVPAVREGVARATQALFISPDRSDHAPPTADAVAFADRLQLTDAGRELFFDAHPTVLAAPQYEVECRTYGFDDVGCFADGAIIVFEVRDPRLDGTMELTAAHELLHAAWSRMSDVERAAIEPSIRAAFATIPNLDATVADYLVYYGVSSIEAPEILDEMHAFVGTDVATVDPVLEAHYARYFADRQSVVALDQLSRLTQIEIRSTQIDLRFGELEEAIRSVQARVAEGSPAYSAAVAEVTALDAEWNSLVVENDRNRAEYDELNELLDSQMVRNAPTPVPAKPGEVIQP